MDQRAFDLGLEHQTGESKADGARVSVLLPLPLSGPLDYAVPDNLKGRLQPGVVVRVPLSGRTATGVIWPGKAAGKQLPFRKLKPVAEIVDVPPFGDDAIRFVDWVSAYTLSSQGAVLRMSLSVPAALEDIPVKRHYAGQETVPVGLRLTPTRQAVLDVLSDGEPRTAPEIADLAGVSDGVVRSLAKAGALVALDIPVDKPYPPPVISADGPTLSAEQEEAAGAICDALSGGGYKPFLLDGITGSGKTEVYFEGLVEALRKPGTQVLVLVPEIALTSQWLGRFEARFGVAPVVWHSEVGQAERRRAWRAIATGDARVVVGARSALFLPYKKLSLIVVDEEHDPSFKQEEGVLYHARDMAVLRAKLTGCPVVLASATPSLESLVNVDEGKYQLLQLRERHGVAVLPAMQAVDLRAEPPEAGAWLSPVLVKAVEETLASGEQAMLFLNRRGYAPLTLCRTCGHRIECPCCSAWLVEHRFRRELQCHHCGHNEPVPEACPTCDSKDSLVACGPGVERLFEEVNAKFANARTAVMTSDTMLSPSQMASMVGQISSGAIDIVIGTQIVTKGYHFPNLTLVGVVDADLGLRGGDLRAGERTYQQLVQVAGRAGRAEKPGRVLLQSYEPEHPVVQALLSGDGETFMNAEKTAREQYHMPPFGKLAAIILSGPDMAQVLEFGRKLAACAPIEQGVDIVGPAPAPMTRIRGQFRFRMLVHARRTISIQKLVRGWLQSQKAPSGVRLKVDIDPYSFS